MSEHKIKYFSETAAETIFKRNQRMERERGHKIIKARAGIADRLEAKALGVTIEEYLEMVS
tara:strand:- start:138 stop:320 length:183 start_codon:yes stop_codon:yes gene_type:complete